MGSRIRICTLMGSQGWDLHKDLRTYRAQDGICTLVGVIMLGFARGFAHLQHPFWDLHGDLAHWVTRKGFARGFCTLMGSRLGFAHLWGHNAGICTGIWLIGSQERDLHGDLHTLIGSRMGFAHL